MSSSTKLPFKFKLNKLSQFSSPVQTISGGTDWKISTTLLDNGTDYLNFSSMTEHSAAIKTDGTLWLWGRGACGALGNNSTTNRSSPVQTIAQGTNWKQVSLGQAVSAAIKTDGRLWLWGFAGSGTLGNNSATTRSSPVQTVNSFGVWKQVSVGCLHVAAVRTNGSLWTWGTNTCGELGAELNPLFNPNRSSPVQTISQGTDWKQASSGCNFTTAIKTDGTLWTWGNNTSGQLGDGTSTGKSSPVQTISGGTNWKQVAAGWCHTTAIKTDGTLWLWGDSQFGKLGINCASVDHSSPVQTISGGTNWKQVAAGEHHTAAIKTDGTLWTWGTNNSGLLGDGTLSYRLSPVQTISGGTDWNEVQSSQYHTLAAKTDGSLWLWGNNDNGKLTDINSFRCAEFDDIYIRKEILNFDEGLLWNWGCNNVGQLGNNSTTNRSSPVQTVSAGSVWVQVSASRNTSAGIKTDGTLWLWGNDGQLGHNSATDRSSPVQTVAQGTNWKQVSGTGTFTAAIKTDGSLWLWGNSSSGQLGNNSTIDRSSPVQTISQGNDWKQVSAGVNHTAAIKLDGSLWLWGEGADGKLGNNATTNRSSPVQTISQGTNWKQVSAGLNHTAAIKNDGTLWLWGLGDNGMLGTNATTSHSSPVQTISQGNNWKCVSVNGRHSAAIKIDGTLWLWGFNTSGQLGINSTLSRSSPVQTISGGNNWKQVSAGCIYTAATKTDGTLWLWGDGSAGKLGDNTTTSKSSPVQTVSTQTYWKQVSAGECHTLAI